MRCAKFTGWFKSNIKPVRVGVYQRKYGRTIRYCHWDGRQWGIGSSDIGRAIEFYYHDCKSLLALPWRGLCKK